jgi:hypothetical protein
MVQIKVGGNGQNNQNSGGFKEREGGLIHRDRILKGFKQSSLGIKGRLEINFEEDVLWSDVSRI